MGGPGQDYNTKLKKASLVTGRVKTEVNFTSSVSLLISRGRLEVMILKTLKAASRLRKGSRRPINLLPFATNRKGRNSSPESLRPNKKTPKPLDIIYNGEKQ